ncbi:MAG: DUF5112 domain-containing protein [Bacteroidaceae bacterium]
MRGKTLSLLIVLTLSIGCMSCTHHQARDEAAYYNRQSFYWRYRNIDSCLVYARKALRCSPQNTSERAEAHCNLAYVAYQQMAYGKSAQLLNEAYHCTADQIELLCADVLAMKVTQRTGDGYTFFTHRNHALQRIARIEEEKDYLTTSQKKKFHYAQTELHIVSSTYYYYLGQDSAAQAEIHNIDLEVSLERDTTQWIYYHYMLGSGGLITGESDYVTQQEFKHLLSAYTIAQNTGCIYFQANCLQSLAIMLADTTQAHLIQSREYDSYSYLVSQFSPQEPAPSTPELSLLLAHKARSLFRSYKDLYQTACAYRTLGEIYFIQQKPQLALSHFQTALSMVEEQRFRDSTIVEPWMAGIHEKLSMAYSALNDKTASDLHRNAYLDLLDQSRQNRELDTRRDILSEEVDTIHQKLFLLGLLVLLVTTLFSIFTRKLQHNTKQSILNLSNIQESKEFQKAIQAKEECQALWQERQEELRQACQATQSHIQEQVQGNLERRAKVSLVYAIVPYLDRMRAEVKRMQKEGIVDSERLRYVGELAEEIMHINELLTEWIQVQRGQLNLHVSTFPLADMFHIISLGNHIFNQKGITLEIKPTNERVKADKALTMFMINTLTDNARKFTPSGGTVTLQASASENYVEISIQDTGEGLSPDDVFTLNHSKVYNPKEIGGNKEGKGFGFGIMNCRGIIEKYKKTSSFFQVCAFGVESIQGQGSRFWFRLPRVLSLCLMLISASLPMNAFSTTASQLFDSVYMANIQGQYEKAYWLGEQAVEKMGTDVDTALLVSLRNEMAISALALKRWSDYRWQNSECVRLHRLYSQDSSLAAYCRQMEKIRFDTNVLYVLMSILSLMALLLFYHLFLRDRLRNRKHIELLSKILLSGHHSLTEYFRKVIPEPRKDFLDHLSIFSPQTPTGTLSPERNLEKIKELRQEVLSLLPQGSPLSQPMDKLHYETMFWVEQTRLLQNQVVELEEQLRKYQFEENRLYVMNQILDNALSTIKHETMYYPARTRQMVMAMSENKGDGQDVEELSDLLESYRQIYMLLYEQASHQSEQRPPLHQHVPLQPLLLQVAQRMARIRLSEEQINTEFSVEETDLVAIGDEVLLRTLLTSLTTPLAGHQPRVRMQAKEQNGHIVVILSCTGTPPSNVNLNELFTPAARCFPFLVARQAVREYDAAFGHPGLRLTAEAQPEGFCILCTMMAGKY